MTIGADAVAVVRSSGFRRLLSVRVAGQLADGVFQVAVTSYVLFSPERQADARSAATAFAILLLPYCLIGPFAGVLIDRWRRRQILIGANILRAGVVVLAALVALGPAPEAALLTVGVIAISINRVVLASLGASIPRVVTLDQVVTANAIAPTVGTLATICGAALGYVLRSAAGGASDTSDSIVMAAAAAGYLCAALLSVRLGPNQLGPAVAERIQNSWAAFGDVGRGLVSGLRAIGRTPKAIDALGVTVAQRFCFGVATVTTILLTRNTFNAPSDPDAGLRALAIVVTATGVGVLLGAVVTPVATRLLGSRRWIPVVLAVGALAQLIVAAPITMTVVMAIAFATGFVAQSVKVTVDSMLQRSMDDEYRGRVFSIYDVVYNSAFVGAAVIAAFALPMSGRSTALPIVCAVVYAVAAFTFLKREPV